MSMPITASTQELADLIDSHLGEEFLEKNPSWKIYDSPVSGRGVFATRDIDVGEVLFREHALLAGPTANKSSKLNTCCVCYCGLEGNDEEIMCKGGCTLPVCDKCINSARHAVECQLFRKWKPKDTTKVNRHSLRLVAIIRCFFLTEPQRKLLYALQANMDKYYMAEVKRASDCFEYFPKEQDMIDYFCRTIRAYNTNAYEGNSCVGGHKVLLRALFPLAGLMNHQCTPNANHHFDDGETIVITAARPIRQGEEIFTSYVKLLWGTMARKVFMAMTKHFMCSCPRCEDPTKLYLYQLKGCKATVDEVFRKVMKDELIALFNFDGRKEKRSLVQLTLINKLLSDVFATEGRNSFEKELKKSVELSHKRYKQRKFANKNKV